MKVETLDLGNLVVEYTKAKETSLFLLHQKNELLDVLTPHSPDFFLQVDQAIARLKEKDMPTTNIVKETNKAKKMDTELRQRTQADLLINFDLSAIDLTALPYIQNTIQRNADLKKQLKTPIGSRDIARQEINNTLMADLLHKTQQGVRNATEEEKKNNTLICGIEELSVGTKNALANYFYCKGNTYPTYKDLLDLRNETGSWKCVAKTIGNMGAKGATEVECLLKSNGDIA